MRVFTGIYLGLLAGSGLLTACHRDAPTQGPTYDLSGRYTLGTTLVAAHPIAMYTKDGLVNNPAVVSRFLARRPALGSTYFSATDVPRASTYTTTLTFRANSRATLLSVSPTYTDSIRSEVTDQKSESFLLQQLDSVDLVTATNQTSCARAEDLTAYLRGTNWGRRCRSLPPVTGYSQLCRVRPLRVIGAHGSQLYIPYYSWLIQAGSCYFAVSGDWNTFNPGIVSRLAVGDTVVVQEREVALHR